MNEATRAAYPLRRGLRALRDGNFDLLIIGGGIYGAWTAVDAAQRGLRVALIERDDWGSGASSASSKLIHGGLRYLERLELGLVRQALEERGRLLRLAPHLVHPLRFVVPVWEYSRLGRIELTLGLRLYDFLAGRGTAVPRSQSLPVAELLREHPFVAPGGLHAAFTYGDSQEDDARLTLGVVAAAQAAGAVVANRIEALSLLRDDRGVHGARVRDHVSAEEFELTASCVVLAAGSWSAALLAERAPPQRRIKGVHLVLPGLPPRDQPDAFLLTAPQDGRVFFVIPWYGHTLVGTTESELAEGQTPRVEAEEVAYLMDAVRHALPGLGWSAADVISAFAGVRSLRAGSDADLSALTREFALLTPLPRLLMPLGGKYTTARSDAVEIVDAAFRQLRRAVPPSQSHERPLPDAPADAFERWRAPWLWRLRERDIPVEAAGWLLRRHGRGIERIERLLQERPQDALPLVPGLPFVRAEVRAAARFEMALSLEDALRRRLPLMLLHVCDPDVLTVCADILAEELGWNAEQSAQELALGAAAWRTMRP